MLIHHFGAETQGFQGLVDQNDRGKALVPEKSHFLKETFFFLEVPALTTIDNEGHKWSNANHSRNNFCF